MLFRKEFFFKIALFKNARKTPKLRILRCKLNQSVFFCGTFFQNLLFRNNSSKSCFLKRFFPSKIRRVVKFLNSKSNALYFFSIQNLMRCQVFKSNSNALWYFVSKSEALEHLFSNLTKLTTFVFEIWFLLCFSGFD